MTGKYHSREGIVGDTGLYIPNLNQYLPQRGTYKGTYDECKQSVGPATKLPDLRQAGLRTKASGVSDPPTSRTEILKQHS